MTSVKFAPPYSGGTAPDLHRTSLLGPCGHLHSLLYSVFNTLHRKPEDLSCFLPASLPNNIIIIIIKNVKLFIINYYKILILLTNKTCYHFEARYSAAPNLPKWQTSGCTWQRSNITRRRGRTGADIGRKLPVDLISPGTQSGDQSNCKQKSYES